MPRHGLDVDCGLAVLRDHRVEVDQVRDAFRNPVGRGGDHQPRVAVADEHHVGEVLLGDQPDHVVDVRVEPHVGTQQVRLVAVAGQGRREHPVAGGREQRHHPLPAPTAVPSTVYQQERGHEETSPPSRKQKGTATHMPPIRNCRGYCSCLGTLSVPRACLRK